MKLTRSLSVLALTAVALAGTLGAQNRGGDNRSAPRNPAPRGQAANRGRQDTPVQHTTAARPEQRGRTDYQNRNDSQNRNGYQVRSGVQNRTDVRSYQDNRARADVRGRTDPRDRVDVRGREGYRGPVDRGRPLITRAGYRGANYGGGYYNNYGNGYRYYRGINRFGISIVLPFGWERPLYLNGYFPSTYAGYCEAVPVDLEYMLPVMRDGYDPCLIGDRVIVYDRYSRGSIVFSAIIP